MTTRDSIGPDVFAALTAAVREADADFEKAYDAGTRTWLDDYFLPALDAHGLTVVRRMTPEHKVVTRETLAEAEHTARAGCHFVRGVAECLLDGRHRKSATAIFDALPEQPALTTTDVERALSAVGLRRWVDCVLATLAAMSSRQGGE